jgi:3-hydroxyacyl-CoA dehydrogenase
MTNTLAIIAAGAMGSAIARRMAEGPGLRSRGVVDCEPEIQAESRSDCRDGRRTGSASALPRTISVEGADECISLIGGESRRSGG